MRTKFWLEGCIARCSHLLSSDEWNRSQEAVPRECASVGGQETQRRDILRYIGIASVAATFPGFRQWAFACSHKSPDLLLSQVSKEPYKLLLFSPEQFR